MIIDFHAHYVPPDWTEELRRRGSRYDCSITEDAAGRSLLRIGDRKPSPLLPSLSDLPRRYEALRQRGLDKQVLSPSLGTVGYHLDAAAGQALSRLFNDTVVETAKQSAGRLIPVGTVPMQSPAAAVEELNHAERRGIRMIEICTNVNGANLDGDAFRPFFRRASELGVVVQVHPNQENCAGLDRLTQYYLSNLIGNPTDTAIAAASLIFGGVMESLPHLNVCLVHGGGTLPYVLGRLSHGYDNVEAAHTTSMPPAHYFRSFYFDTIVHDPLALRFLRDLVGADRLLLGSDYPYDNSGEPDPVGFLKRAGLGDDRAILGDTAAKLLSLTVGDKQ
jgi:aminocarboxymuconate-semialdehyde decarboxylase